MNARLDLLAMAADRPTGTFADAFTCCPRYTAAADDAPELGRLLVQAAEWVARWFGRDPHPAIQTARPIRR
jgi:hypothetical protein